MEDRAIRYKRGDVHPVTGLYFWAYHKTHAPNGYWYTKDKFDKMREHLNNHVKGYHKTPAGIAARERRDEKRKIEKKERARLRYKEATKDPFAGMWHTLRTRCITASRELSITREDLLRMYEDQDGKCHYTGVDMHKAWATGSPYQMSIDRRDSKIGYTRDNTVLCCQSINYAKNKYGESEFVQFLEDVCNVKKAQEIGLWTI